MRRNIRRSHNLAVGVDGNHILQPRFENLTRVRFSATDSQSSSGTSEFSLIQHSEFEDGPTRKLQDDEHTSSHPTDASPLSESGKPSSLFGSPSFAAAENSQSGKVKFFCSFGGRILPRPSDGELRYVGGDSRIISTGKNVSWKELKTKSSAICNQPHTVKYQLPGEDLDALVSVSSDEDLQNMIEEYHGLKNIGGLQRFRIFLVPFSESVHSCNLNPRINRLNDPEYQYVVAVNGMVGADHRALKNCRTDLTRQEILKIDNVVLAGSNHGMDHAVYDLKFPESGGRSISCLQEGIGQSSNLNFGVTNLCPEIKSMALQEKPLMNFESLIGDQQVKHLDLEKVSNEKTTVERPQRNASWMNNLKVAVRLQRSVRQLLNEIYPNYLQSQIPEALVSLEPPLQHFVDTVPKDATLLRPEEVYPSVVADADHHLILHNSQIIENLTEDLYSMRAKSLFDDQSISTHMDQEAGKLGDPECVIEKENQQDLNLEKFSELDLLESVGIAKRLSSEVSLDAESHDASTSVTATETVVEDSVYEDKSDSDESYDELITDAMIAEMEAQIYGLQIVRNADLEEIRKLGSGTYGTVYHGKWKGTDVVIKRINTTCLSGRSSEKERLIKDFWREARILSDLHHPNIVALYGVVPDGEGGTLATITEYMTDGSLRNALLMKHRSLDCPRRLSLALDAAFGMEYLHSKNVVHFDLKCDNLLVNLWDPQRPVCKVGDFGLSRMKHSTILSGGLRGTLPWMAPELLNGNMDQVSEKVDVFSFGISLWEILTGKEPYADMHCGKIIRGIVKENLRPTIPEGCDPHWRKLMEDCWASDPEARPSFSEITSRLREMGVNLLARWQNNLATQKKQNISM